ncbi:MAG: hypothetical protein Q9180_001217 [Flavoplaca navasiana]
MRNKIAQDLPTKISHDVHPFALSKRTLVAGESKASPQFLRAPRVAYSAETAHSAKAGSGYELVDPSSGGTTAPVDHHLQRV